MKQTAFICVLLLSSLAPSFGQILTNFYNFDHVNQNLLVNPANQHPVRFTLGLPGISGVSVHFTNTLLKAGNILNDNSLNQNIEEIIADMPKNGRINLYETVDLFYLGFRLKRGYVSFGAQQEATLNTIIPQQLASFLYYGNADDTDSGLFFANKDYNTEALVQVNYHFGYQHYIIDSTLIIGGRYKYISGIGHAHFQQFNAELNADMFQWNMTTDILLETSGSDYIESFNFDPLEFLNSDNRGYSVDAGVSVILPKVKLSAAVLNIGQITWTQNLKMYQSRGTFTYDGANIDDTNQDITFDSVLDSFETKLRFRELQPYSYTARLPMHILASYEYRPHPKHAFAVTYQGSMWSGNLNHILGINYVGRYARRFNLLLGYSIIGNSLNNVAFGMSAALGSLQLYALCDNVYGAFNPKELSSTSVRFGLNFASFDRITKRSKKPSL